MDAELARIEHLKMIQTIIERMARTSFAVRAVASTIAAGLVAVTFSVGEAMIAAYGAAPVGMLWTIDSYYLSIERQFRRRYDEARNGTPPKAGSDEYFSMKLQGGGWRSQLSAMISRPGFLYFAALLALLGGSAYIVARSTTSSS